MAPTPSALVASLLCTAASLAAALPATPSQERYAAALEQRLAAVEPVLGKISPVCYRRAPYSNGMEWICIV
jgi:hypothetical protein